VDPLLNTILLQICEEFIGDVADFFGKGDKVKKIEEMESTLKEKADTFLLNMIKAYLENLDQALVEDKTGRRQQGLVIERRGDQREQYLLFGQLTFKRTYFYDKINKEYTYLLDKAVGIESYERISGNVVKELIEHASESSYQESTRHVTGGAISRQTVMKRLHSLQGLKVKEPASKRDVKVLYVNADEDHAALQSGRNTIVPLISIHEGIKKEGQRGHCINPHFISSHGKMNEQLWLEAAEWIYNAYKVDSIERIYLHGDGAPWIKEGLNWLPKARAVLDSYHLNKAILTVTSRQVDKRADLYKALSKGDKEAYLAIIKGLKQDAKEEGEKKRIQDFHRYITNNWAGVIIHGQEECGGSCTEGHVSHVLSSRLSSRPMAWSREGLRVMAELRAYKKSGGKIEIEHLKGIGGEGYKIEKRLVKETNKAFGQITRESFNNVTILKHGKVIPMFNCLRGIQSANLRI
jgi:hypothetical protein